MLKENNKSVEILAPCSSFENVKVAVFSGADAVYLGLDKLNARQNAQNFTPQELKETVAFCHTRAVKVYLALNTIVYEDELSDLLEMVVEASNACVDGVIVQDLSCVNLIKKVAPQLKLHGSTQMSVHNLEGVLALEKMGFSRVVLARELTKDEIKHIRENTNIELEIFVHGALCMAVSGQCYLSSMIGRRSGNKGVCAQPCRLAFKSDNGTGFDLSLKDLSLVKKVAVLRDMGINSLKIEGRMKRPEYVASAVASIKEMLEKGEVDKELYKNLQGVFARSGFTSGYFDNMMGLSMFGTRTRSDVTAATTKVLNSLSNIYKKEYPRVAVDFKMKIKKDTPLTLSVSDGKNKFALKTKSLPEIAINKPTQVERIKASLEKTGDTPFKIGNIEVDLDDGLCVKVSELNSLRRVALERLLQKREAIQFGNATVEQFANCLEKPVATPKKPASKKELRLRFQSVEMIDIPAIIKVLSDNQNRYNFSIQLPYKEIIKHQAKLAPLKDVIIGELPRIDFKSKSNTSDMLELKEFGVTKVWCGNLGSLYIANKYGLEPIAGFSLNITNSKSAGEYAKQFGCGEIELSFENQLANIKKIMSGAQANFSAMVYGYLPLMSFRNCPINNGIDCVKCKKEGGYLTDRLGNKFYVRCDGFGSSEMYNCKMLYLKDRISDFDKLDILTLYFTYEKPAQIEKMLNVYLDKEKEQFSDITRGLYYR